MPCRTIWALPLPSLFDGLIDRVYFHATNSAPHHETVGLIGDEVTRQGPDLEPYPWVIDTHDPEAVDHFPYAIG